MTMDMSPRQILKFMLFSPFVLASPLEPFRPSNTQWLNVTSVKILHARNGQPSAFPYGEAAPGEFLYLDWDPKNADQKKRGEKIHEAFVEWGQMAKLAVKEAANLNSPHVKRWFGRQDDPKETEAVFALMWDLKDDKPAAPVGSLVCEQTDFKKRCTATTRAYMVADTGHFHICPAGDNLPLNKDIKCTSLDGSCSNKMRSLPMTMLHEMTHATSIGTEGHGGLAIIDEASNAFPCFELKDDDKGDNAQNYAWFAGELFWTNQCHKTFVDPTKNTDAGAADDGTAE